MNTLHNNEMLLQHVKQTITKSITAKQEFFQRQGADLLLVAQKMADVVQNNRKILIFGNGGSAADAQHMAAEMIGKMLVPRKKPLAALALTTDTSCLTAVGNDYHYDDIFDLQLRGLAQKGDMVFAISTSGKSKNVIKAVSSAKALGLYTVSMTGGNGGHLRELSDTNLNVALGENSSMIQETHIAIVHLLVDLMDRFYLSPEYVEKN